MTTLIHIKSSVPDDRAADLFRALCETVRQHGGTPLEQWAQPFELKVIEGGKRDPAA